MKIYIAYNVKKNLKNLLKSNIDKIEKSINYFLNIIIPIFMTIYCRYHVIIVLYVQMT